jgi:hypothetical protein
MAQIVALSFNEITIRSVSACLAVLCAAYHAHIHIPIILGYILLYLTARLQQFNLHLHLQVYQRLHLLQ